MSFKHKHLQNIHINGTVLKVRAKEFAVTSNIQFAPLRNGLNDVRNCSGIVHRTVTGEAWSVDGEAMEMWRFPIFQAKFAEYEPRTFFNVHKSGLFVTCYQKNYWFIGPFYCRSQQQVAVLLRPCLDCPDKLLLLVSNVHYTITLCNLVVPVCSVW